MGRNSNPTRGSTIRHVVHIIAAGVAAAATLAAGMLVPATNASTTNVVKMGSQKTVTRMTISTMFSME